MKIILIGLIIIIIYYLFNKKSCGCDGFNGNCECFNNIKSSESDTNNEAVELTDPDLIKKLIFNRNNDLLDTKLSKKRIDSYYDDKFNINSILGVLKTVLPNLENKDNDGKIHLNELPKCKVPMKSNLINNYNYIINTGTEIYQDILKPESNKIFIHNIRHNLMKFEWVKSSLVWYGDNIKLEIRFTCVNPTSGQRVHIVFPLILVDTYMQMEKFTDTYYNLNLNKFEHNFSRKNKGIMFPILENKLNTFTQEIMENPMIKELNKNSDLLINQMKTGMMPRIVDESDFQPNNTFNQRKVYHSEDKIKEILKNTEIKKIIIDNIPKSVNLNNLKNTLDSVNFNFITREIKNVKYSYRDIDTLLNLNSLMVDVSLIPEYICCSSNIGQLINIDFDQIEKKIVAQDTFYYTHENDGSLVLITQPYPYEKKIGNAILENYSSNNSNSLSLSND